MTRSDHVVGNGSEATLRIVNRFRESEADQSMPGSSSEACDSGVSFDNLNPQISSTPPKEKVKKRLREYLYSRRNITHSDANDSNDGMTVFFVNCLHTKDS